MTVDWLDIEGLRGFGKPQRLNLAVPNGENGSGLTSIVGPNNSGKSTLTEAFRYLMTERPSSFSEGIRSLKAGGRVSISVGTADALVGRIRTVDAGGSQSTWDPKPESDVGIFALPSRRTFSPYFGIAFGRDRRDYMMAYEPPSVRGRTLDEFSSRLFRVQDRKEEFDQVLGEVIDPPPQWFIDQAAQGGYYLKVQSGSTSHSSEGLGEGIVSLLFIVDALYDSDPGQIVVIDEPELSLHPSLQRRLMSLFLRFASDRQIILATHSPYFVEPRALAAGARLIRTRLEDFDIRLHSLTAASVSGLQGLLTDAQNPHVLGLDAREVFFLEDRVILVEGQEDVLGYEAVLRELRSEPPGHFYGWGVGGAGKMNVISRVLTDLGFSQVVGVLDSDKAEEGARLREQFPHYAYVVSPFEDVRDKPSIQERPAQTGLLDHRLRLHEENRERAEQLIHEIRDAFPAP